MTDQHERAKKIAAQAGDLPALPQVSWKVLRLTSDSSSTAQMLEEVISRDQALTAKVLKMSNSPYFGVRGEISTVSQAIVVIGLRRLRSLVVAASIDGLFQSKTLKDTLLWEHSLATALSARRLSSLCDFEGSEEAFVAALMHDIGKPILDRNLKEHYQQVVERVYNEGTTFRQAEQQLLGFDHAEVGGLLTEKWGFSVPLQEAVRLHHDPESAVESPQLCAIVSLANSICVKLGIGPEKDPDLDLAQLPAARILNLEREQIDDVIDALNEDLAKEKGTLGMG